MFKVGDKVYIICVDGDEEDIVRKTVGMTGVIIYYEDGDDSYYVELDDYSEGGWWYGANNLATQRELKLKKILCIK